MRSKFRKNSASDDRAQSDMNQQVLCAIAEMVLELVMSFYNGGDIRSGAL
jgi:hypothetical protein